MKGKHYINNEWVIGLGEKFTSTNPANEEALWSGSSADVSQIKLAVQSGKKAFPEWSNLEFNKRLESLKRFQTILVDSKKQLTEILSQEIGKPLWEAETEIDSMINKIPISVEAYQERCKMWVQESPSSIHKLRHKAHGVVAVFGAFNFPAHLPNGHIVPALLAGNTIIFKPSELAPFIAEKMIECWEKAELPKGVINLVQGVSEVGRILSQNTELDGLFFTGSYKTGVQISQQLALSPEKILALEMGGNNPLIVHEIGNHFKEAVYYTIQSAYITAGQRCTCARRLIVVKSKNTENFITSLIESIQKLKVGPYNENPEPFLGPVISIEAANHIMNRYEALVAQGAKVLVPLKRLFGSKTFLSPGLIDVSALEKQEDEEIFGPLLQLRYAKDFNEALEFANDTEYGLAAGILCEKEQHYLHFLANIRAGVVSWNRPLTGASSRAPFGGVGHSGNHRPSGFYAADYCSYPVACTEANELTLPQKLPPGVTL